MSQRQLVLVVDSDPVHRRLLLLALRSYGYAVAEATDAREAQVRIGERLPDALLVDPFTLGVAQPTEYVQRLHGQAGPILVVAANAPEPVIVATLNAGASDFIFKPFREGELVARLKATLRDRNYSTRGRQIVVGDLRVDGVARAAWIGERNVELTNTEFELLQLLASEAGRVVSHQRLLSEVWSNEHAEDVQYLRVFVRQLRRKLEPDKAHPRRIVTALGVGYRLVPLPAD
jgi:two-component system KDP operon response regulator KdpE